MALRKPLVINAGEVQQLQAGDTLDAPVAAIDVIQATNGNGSPITLGQVVYPDAANSVDLAQANALATTDPIGLVAEASIAPAASGSIQTDGVIANANWTPVTGGPNLTTGAEYYLSASDPGQLTTVAPTTVGQYVVKVGRALSTTELLIEIDKRIHL